MTPCFLPRVLPVVVDGVTWLVWVSHVRPGTAIGVCAVPVED